MQKITKLSLAVAFLMFAASCGKSNKDTNAVLNDKKVSLEKKKKEKGTLETDIKKLEDDIAKLDTNSANAAKIKLVSVAPVTTQNFQHYIDLQGKVDAENISYISPRMGPAQVTAVYVKEGQPVRKGQLLLKLDDAILKQSIEVGRKNLETIKTQLAFAKNIYQRQKNLWEQNIGTEVQVITAKTNVETLEGQLHSAEQNIKVTQEQLNTANVYSDVSGIADVVNIHVGETFSGMGANGPQIKIVNTSNLKIVVTVPENYLTRIHKGSTVEINIPDANKKVTSTISLISQSIDATQRGFIAESRIPNSGDLKPNQSAIMRILDYASANVIVIPVNMVQSDEKSKYVYVLDKLSSGKTVAKKKTVIIGEVYANSVEIKSGLTLGEQLITEGYQNLYEGQVISTELKKVFK